MKAVIALSICALLAGCVALPTAPSTHLPTSSEGAFVEMQGPDLVTLPVPSRWWRLFADPLLNDQVERALSANADLRVAIANLDAARELARSVESAGQVRGGLESGAGAGKAVDQPSTTTVTTTDYDLGATLAYELDFFGRARAAAAMASADARVSAAILDELRVAVAADTVIAYMDWCSATASARVAEEAVASQSRSAELVEAQFQEGEVSALERAQARAAVARAQALVAPHQAEMARALYQLAALQGRPPAHAKLLIGPCTKVPTLTTALPVGDGATMIARRPDIRTASARLASAIARLGVAHADLYPRISLGASAGLSGGGFNSALTPLITWAFLDRRGVRARIASADAASQAALAMWDAAVLRALREVESNMAAYRAEINRQIPLLQGLVASHDTVRRARARYDLGDESYLLVLDAQLTRSDMAAQVADSEARIARQQVALFRVLGGGWE